MKFLHFALPLALLLTASPVFSANNYNVMDKENPRQPITFESKLQDYLEDKVEERKLWAFLASQKYMEDGEMVSTPLAKNRGPNANEVNLIVEAIDRIHQADIPAIRFNHTFFNKIDNLFNGAQFETSDREESKNAYTGQLLRYYIIAHRDQSVEELEEVLSTKGIDSAAIERFHTRIKGIEKKARSASPQRSPRVEAVSKQLEIPHPTTMPSSPTVDVPTVPKPKKMMPKSTPHTHTKNAQTDSSSQKLPHLSKIASIAEPNTHEKPTLITPQKLGSNRLAFLSPTSSFSVEPAKVTPSKIDNPFEKKISEHESTPKPQELDSTDFLTRSVIELPSERKQRESFHSSDTITQPSTPLSFAEKQRLAKEAAKRAEEQKAEETRLEKEARLLEVELKRKEAARKKAEQKEREEQELRIAAEQAEIQELLAKQQREEELRLAREASAARREAERLAAEAAEKEALRANSRRIAAEMKAKKAAINANASDALKNMLAGHSGYNPDKTPYTNRPTQQESSTETRTAPPLIHLNKGRAQKPSKQRAPTRRERTIVTPQSQPSMSEPLIQGVTPLPGNSGEESTVTPPVTDLSSNEPLIQGMTPLPGNSGEESTVTPPVTDSNPIISPTVIDAEDLMQSTTLLPEESIIIPGDTGSDDFNDEQ